MVGHAALFDELEKIAEKNPKLKKWIRNAALITAGAGAGTAVAMVADRALTSVVGSKFNSLSRDAKMKLLGLGLGIATTGAYMAGTLQKRVEDGE